MKRIFGAALLPLLGLAGFACSMPARAYMDVSYPPATTCPASVQPPSSPGTTPGYPGHWFNPDRYGSGWDLLYSADHTMLVVVWFTFDQGGRPIWLVSDPQPFKTSSSTTHGTRWKAGLYKVTWQQGRTTPEKVGSVAITFPVNSTTRASLRWQWDEVSTSRSYDECLYDIFLDTPAYNAPRTSAANGYGEATATQALEINDAFTGTWFAPDHPGWGVDIVLRTLPGGDSFEVDTAHIFDLAGEPVWVQAQTRHHGRAPATATNPLYYIKHPTGLPIRKCSTAECIDPHRIEGNALTRTLDGVAHGTLKLRVKVDAATTGAAGIDWPRAPLPIQETVVRLTEIDRVITDEVHCTGGAAASCTVVVNWASQSDDTRLYRHDLTSDTTNPKPLAAQSTGQFTDTLQAGERIRYELRRGGATGKLLSSSSEVRALILGDAPPATMPGVPSPDPVSDAVGYLGGQFRVDESGSATYRIPLALPPGRGGLTPPLAIAYHSGAGDGPLGMGMALDGLSVITKCRKTTESGDGRFEPISQYAGPTSTANEAEGEFRSGFCLDGQRLRLIAGREGRAGAEYRTEIDTFQRVVVDSEERITMGSGVYFNPVTFTVWRKDGTIVRLGGEARRLSHGDLVTQQPFASEWWQSELRDTNGNVVTYGYARAASGVEGSLRLARIGYVGGQVDFSYDEREFPVIDYTASLPVALSEWLRQIDVRKGGQLLHSYVPTYEPTPYNPALRRMAAIRDCAGAVCQAETVLAWHDPPAARDAQTTAGSGFAQLASFKYGDVDGDGRADIVWADRDRNVYVSFSRPTASGIGFSAPVLATRAEWNDEQAWYVYDFNADGRDDLLVYRDGAWRILFSNGNGFDASGIELPDSRTTATASDKPLVVLADFDGDGLGDVLVMDRYTGGRGERAWLTRKSGNPTPSQPDRMDGPHGVVFEAADAGLCMLGSQQPFNRLSRHHSGAVDFDGNGAADLALRLAGPLHCVPRRPRANATQDVLAEAEAIAESADALQAGNQDSVYRFMSQGLSENGRALMFKTYSKFGEWPAAQGVELDTLQFVDINGDGLTDSLWHDKDGSWKYRLNNGFGFQPAVSVPGTGDCGAGGRQCDVQLLDYDGDGRLDFWVANAVAGGSYAVHLWTGNGFAANAVETFARHEGAGWRQGFADIDGDGYYDNLNLKTDSGSGEWTARRTSGHHRPRNVVASIGQGLGNATWIDYAPLTFASVYAREYTGWSLQSGRGSPVQDVLVPRFVVAAVRSSAPVENNPDATAEVRYRYAGFRMQGGGRGSLGFERVYTLDTRNRIETRTAYYQAFPLTGLPRETVTVTAAGWADPCAGGAEAPGCMAYGPAWTDDDAAPGRIVINRSTDVYESREQGGGALKPIVVLRTSSNSVSRDLRGAQIAAESTSGMTYDPFGNLLTSTTTNADANGATIRTVVTRNDYDNKGVSWLLGRLRRSSVTTTRNDGGVTSSVTRVSSFDYDPQTGQLSVERLQPDAAPDLALIKTYTYDAYGNRTQSSTCSRDVGEAACRTLGAANMAFHPAGETTLQRYARTAFDADGIFADMTSAAFWNGNSTTERVVAKVERRDAWGNPVQTTGANGLVSMAAYGAFGRKYFEGNNGGAAVTTSYRWCQAAAHGGDAVPCPAGAVYRLQAVTAGAPTAWTYFDRLDREVLRVREGFQAGEYSAVAKTYDELGRPYRVSEPFATAPPMTSAVGSGASHWTTTHYNALGQPTRIDHPNGSTTEFRYDGLTTTATMPPNQGGVRETRRERHNALGEVVEVIDHYGSVLSYARDVAGNVIATTRRSAEGKVITSEARYDDLGRRIWMRDPDAGEWNYVFDALGEEVRRYTATSCTRSRYDGLGRLWSRTDYRQSGCSGPADAETTWAFDTAPHGLGQLDLVSGQDGGATYTRQHRYDELGREVGQESNVSGSAYRQTSRYDQFGRAFQSLFEGDRLSPAGEQNEYNAQGYLTAVRDAYAPNAAPYYAVQAMNARGQVTAERRGTNDRLATTREYDPATGRLRAIVTGGGAVQDLHYDYDPIGNMQSREDRSEGGYVHEDFRYDGLQRLTTATITLRAGQPGVVRQYRYDGHGNLVTSPVSAEAYRYGERAPLCTKPDEATPGPAALTSLNGNQYCYDAHGNLRRMLDPANAVLEKKTVAYTAYDLPRELRIHNPYSQHTTRFQYGPERQRVRRTDQASADGSGLATVTDTLGATEVVARGPGGAREVRRYVPGAILIARVDGEGRESDRQTVYLFTDALGSTHRLTDGNGMPLGTSGRQAFDAFGRRADPASGAGLGNAAEFAFPSDPTAHGYTGHEQLDAFTWIHMNGRLYDVQTGRFLQADSVVGDAGDLQAWNRYSYVLNNPLAYTDPSGHWGKKQQRFLRLIAATIISVYTGGTAAGMSWGYFGTAVTTSQAVAAGIIGGFAAGAVQSGTLKGAALGAFSGAVGGWVAAPATGLAGTGQGLLMLATSGGITEELAGGHFGHGFMAAGLSAAAGAALHTGNTFADGVLAAMAGGTIAEATGGKFANGAVTAAVSFAFRKIASEAMTGSGSGMASSSSRGTDVSLVPGEYGSPESAVNAFGQANAAAARASRSEYQAGIVELWGGDGFGPPAYAYTSPFTGDPGSTVVSWGRYLPALRSTYGNSLYGYAHIHADNNMIFSPSDYRFVHQGYSPLYLYNQNNETRILTESIVRRAITSANIRGPDQVAQYMRLNNGFPGVCVYGCDQ